MKTKYELIIFDWDGTLMDSAAKIVNCFAAAARDAGAPVPTSAAARHVIGLGLTEAVDTLFARETRAMRARIAQAYREHFLELDDTAMPMFPGVNQGLEGLHRQGRMLAIATGKSRRGLERALRETAMAHLFAASRCADEAYSKPHPKMLEDILEITGIDVTQAIMVGDTIYDLEMARNAGMASLAVTYGVHDRASLEALAPLACLDSFEEICRWLQ